jgi:hypothetical protein
MAGPKRLERDRIIEIDGETGRAIPLNDENEPSLEADQDKLLEDVLAEFDSTDDDVVYTARVNRVLGAGKAGIKEPYLFSVDAAEIHGVRDRLRDGYGSGTYRIRIYRNNKIARQLDYQIEAPAPGKSTVNSTDPSLATIVEIMRENEKRTMELMERIASKSTAVVPTGQPDMLTMFEKFSTIMKNMMPVAPPVSETNLDTFMKAAEFVRDMTPETGGGGDGGWIGILKEIARNPSVGDAIGNILATRGQPQRRQPANITQPPNNSIAPPVVPNASDTPINSQSQAALGEQLQSNIRYLIGRAEAGRDPSLYAEWLLDNTNEQLITTMVNDPNLLVQLEPAFPRMTPHHDWFVALIEDMKSLIGGGFFKPEEGVHEPIGNATHGAGGEGGDNRHPETDGQVDAGGSPRPDHPNAGG